MLVLTITKDRGECFIELPDGREIEIISVKRSSTNNNQVSLGFKAPDDIKIHRFRNKEDRVYNKDKEGKQ